MKSIESKNLLTASKFAEALDTEDYDTAKNLLSPNCVYHSGTTIYEGPHEIINVYKKNGDWAAKTFDNIEYESRVEPAQDSTTITFVDKIQHNGKKLNHQCKQNVYFDNSEMICKIEHEELPGESEALEKFFAETGVTKRENKTV